MKCQLCHRELKNHDASGMGPVCKMKANLSSEIAIKKIRIEPLYTRRTPRRSYLVFTTPRRRVVVSDTTSGRFAVCDCAGNAGCEHISLVADFDNTRFPQQPESAPVFKQPMF